MDEADQVIILLTDGEDNASEPMAIAAEARQLGVRIFTVGIGSKSGQPVMKFDAKGEPDGWVKDDEGNVVMTRLDEETLEAIAEETALSMIWKFSVPSWPFHDRLSPLLCTIPSS